MKKHLLAQFMRMIYVCLATAGFASLAQAKPLITSFSPESGPIGTLVTITRDGLNTTSANKIIFFGATGTDYYWSSSNQENVVMILKTTPTLTITSSDMVTVDGSLTVAVSSTAASGSGGGYYLFCSRWYRFSND